MRCHTCDTDFDPAASSALPFCSDRCRTIDLGRWLDERYHVPEVRLAEEGELQVEDEPSWHG